MPEDITKDEIIKINKGVTSGFGEAFGMINEGNLDFLVSKIKNADGPHRKAAELLSGIARGHPFLDGNKRTAFQSAVVLLKKNKIRLIVDPKDGEKLMLDVASSESLTVKKIDILD